MIEAALGLPATGTARQIAGKSAVKKHMIESHFFIVANVLFFWLRSVLDMFNLG